MLAQVKKIIVSARVKQYYFATYLLSAKLSFKTSQFHRIITEALNTFHFLMH